MTTTRPAAQQNSTAMIAGAAARFGRVSRQVPASAWAVLFVAMTLGLASRNLGSQRGYASLSTPQRIQVKTIAAVSVDRATQDHTGLLTSRRRKAGRPIHLAAAKELQGIC